MCGTSRTREVAWPIAVVAESPDDLSIVFRTYCSQWPVDGIRHIRPPILKGGDAYPSDVVGRFLTAMDAGDSRGRSWVPSRATGICVSRSASHSDASGRAASFAPTSPSVSAAAASTLSTASVTDDGDALCA